MKLCIDCKYHMAGGANKHRCVWVDPEAPAVVSPVTGRRTLPAATLCEVERRYITGCGPDGANFEPRPPPIRDLLTPNVTHYVHPGRPRSWFNFFYSIGRK